jgi:hypothetical protein
VLHVGCAAVVAVAPIGMARDGNAERATDGHGYTRLTETALRAGATFPPSPPTPLRFFRGGVGGACPEPLHWLQETGGRVEPEERSRARVKAGLARGLARGTSEVIVERVSLRGAVGRFDVPQTWPGFELYLNVAPVLAADLPEAGLVLSDQHLVVSHASERGTGPEGGVLGLSNLVRPTVVVEVWGAESTFTRMAVADWGFVLGAGRDVPVPAYVTSHLRCLAFYTNLVWSGAAGAATLQRWADAIAAVELGVEVLCSVFGRGPRSYLANAEHLDLTFEQVLAGRDKYLAWSWLGSAGLLVRAARKAHRAVRRTWEECGSNAGAVR